VLLTGSRRLAGELRRLVALAEGQDMEELGKMVRNAVGAPAPVTAPAEPSPRITGPRVETDFEV
jgi:hypothetical protein